MLDGDAAFAVLEGATDDRVDLVNTDLSRSSVSGLALIERVRLRWPELAIVVIAGLAVSEQIEAVRRKNIPLLCKPFGPDTLDATIRRALGLARACSSRIPSTTVRWRVDLPTFVQRFRIHNRPAASG